MRWLQRSLLLTVYSAVVLGAAAGGAIAAVHLPAPDQGLRLGYANGQVVVASVDYESIAQRAGLQTGQVVVNVDGVDLFNLPDAVKRVWAEDGGPWHEVLTATTDQYKCDGAGTCALLPPFESYTTNTYYLCIVSQPSLGGGNGEYGIGYLCPQSLPGSPTLTVMGTFGGPPQALHDLGFPTTQQPSDAPLLLGLAVLTLGWLFLRRGWAGPTLREYAVSLPLATAVPLIVVSIDGYPSAMAAIGGAVLVPLSMLPLAIDLLGSIEGKRRRWFAGVMTVLLAAGSCIAGLLMSVYFDAFAIRNPIVWRVVLAAAVPLVPGVFTAWSRRRSDRGTAVAAEPTPRSLVDSIDVLLAAMTPGAAAVSLFFRDSIELWPILLWIVFVLGATRLAVLPLARLATLSRQQRDLVMNATEAERARIAADIHDFALQDLTMLVRRLDSAGDTESAESAREVAERLRAISGELRLPVLDDLGVGPALEWLCGRLSQASGPIELDRAGDETRLPADVELAVFRIAQEAVSNAIRHGGPPIRVRYRSNPQAVELAIDDAGAGISDADADLAARTGHLGMLNMTQRAEAIGATLEIGRQPAGGTRVALTWRAPTTPETAFMPEPA